MTGLDERQRERYRLAGGLAVVSGVLLVVAHCSQLSFLGYVGAGMFCGSFGLWVSAQ